MAGIYIHIPFCKSKCTYCDFASYPKELCKMESYFACLYSRFSGKWNCSSSYGNDIYVNRGLIRLYVTFSNARAFYCKRLDVGNCSKCNPLFTYALALLHNAAYHQKGNRKYQMDTRIIFNPNYFRIFCMLYFYSDYILFYIIQFPTKIMRNIFSNIAHYFIFA